jgi:hypothetical protein
VQHQCERRLGRPLTEAEHDVVTRRYESVGPDRLGDVVLDLEPEALDRWRNDPDAI